jgi:hypothetical protein
MSQDVRKGHPDGTASCNQNRNRFHCFLPIQAANDLRRAAATE